MHKKTLTTLIISSLLLASVLSACSTKNVKLIDTVFISELYHGDNLQDCAVEITANELTEINTLKVNFYKGHDLIKSLSLKDEMPLNKDETLVIMNKDFLHPYEVEGRTLTLEDNYIANCFYFEIVDEANQVIDSISYKGYNLINAENESLIRLKEHFKARPVYRELDFIRVSKKDMKYLGNTNCPLTLDEFLKGPKLDEKAYGNEPFLNADGSPKGGYVPVTIRSLGDGDTTQFNWPKGSGISNSYKERVRYLLCDTPETYHGPGGVDPEPFGQEAQRYNNNKLSNASKIYVQSNKDYSVHDTYGRTLGYVWYADVKNPKISDFKLLNYELVLLGLARATFRERYETMISNDIYYSEYFKYAFKLAEEQGLKIHGEVDPEFNY